MSSSASTFLKAPLALFDDIDHIDIPHVSLTLNEEFQRDYKYTLSFLKAYTGSQGTFNSYRREVEKLLHWSWRIAQKSITTLKRDDIEAFIVFCQKPRPDWIGLQKVPRFIDQGDRRVPNPKWRPFVVTITKSAHRKGQTLDIKKFSLSQGAIKETFAILSSYFNYLLQEEYIGANPVALIRQKSKFIRKNQSTPKIRRLSELQWEYVIHTAQEMAEIKPELHERTLFIMTILYTLYLRISELTASKRWQPKMCDFFRDHEGNWWFTTVGKGNKERQIAVSDVMLAALKRYRKFLNLSAFPSPSDQTPLLPKLNSKGPLTSTTYIRDIVQICFDKAIFNLQQANHQEEAESLNDATVHWLRHTGISDDVKRRPREHVRDDAGHSSSAITDKYIDITLLERHASARKKPITT